MFQICQNDKIGFFAITRYFYRQDGFAGGNCETEPDSRTIDLLDKQRIEIQNGKKH